MNNSWLVVAGMAVCLNASGLLAAWPQQDRLEQQNITSAEETIVLNTAIVSSPKARDRDYVCVGVRSDSIQLALAVIGDGTSPRMMRALSRLMRFVLDGMAGEEYDEYVLAKGLRIRQSLQSLNPTQLHDECAQEFAKFQKDRSYAAEIEGANENEVCVSAVGIKEHVRELLGALANRPGQER